MNNYLDEALKNLLTHAVKHLTAASIEQLGTWLASNPPTSDSDEDRQTFMDALWTALDEGGDAVTPGEN